MARPAVATERLSLASEGEETSAQLFPLFEHWSAKTDPASGTPVLDPRHTLDLDEDALAPDYSDLDLHRCLAPNRMLLCAPTRGGC